MAQLKGNSGQTGGGDFGQTGTGDFGQTGTGDFGQTGTGDFGQTGTGDFGQTGTGDFGQTGTGDFGQTGTGVAGPPKTTPKASSTLGPTVIAQRRLNFKIQRQEQSEWCWAACAASVETFFSQDPDFKAKQCEAANKVLKSKDLQGDSCDDPEDFNRPGKLMIALQKFNKWRNTLDDDDSTGATGALTFEQVQREIDRGRPVCCGITWKSGGGHFVVVRGYRVLDSGAQQLYVADPLNPANLVDFDEFTTAYYGEGRWTETSFVVSDLVTPS